MDENEQQVLTIANRNEAFGAGLVGGQVQAPPSLQEEAARYRAATPREYKPSGSFNGMAQGQYENTLGGAFRKLPTAPRWTRTPRRSSSSSSRSNKAETVALAKRISGSAGGPQLRLPW